MTTHTSHPYEWVKEIEPELRALDEIPLTGASPPFPWDQLGTMVGRSLEQSVEIIPGEIKFRTKKTLYEGLGESPFPLVASIPSLDGYAAWVMPEQEMANLEALLLTKENHPITFPEHDLSKAFYRFLALEVLYNVSELKLDKSLVPILTTKTAFPEEDALCCDISVTIRGQTLWGRLMISRELRRSWIDHFSKQGRVSPLTQKLKKVVETIIHLEVGKINLSAEEWSGIQLGDWIALDQFFLDPVSLSGRVMLTLNGKNIFIGRLKEKNIKIVDFPLYHEAEAAMAKKTDEEDFETIDENDEIELEDLTHDDDFELDETFETDADEPLETDDSAVEVEKKKHPKSEAKAEDPPQGEFEKKNITPRDIPVTLTVEVGQVQMTMEKLLSLEPGNLLDLNVTPENGVDLLIAGKRVGKGDLIRLGESIGIRIMELG